jgi:probable F420-dependent oxidoreductase
MPEMQFGVAFHEAAGQREFADVARRADELGFDVFAAPDHLGAMAPFAVLAAAGSISPRLRLRTYVLNEGFWNPALLAREVATLDVLSQGRAELGLGAGHMKSEHVDARLPWLPLAERTQRMDDTAAEVRRRLEDPDHQPRPVQRPVPLMIAAMARAGLAVAARHADIVGFAGLRQVPGAPAGTFTLSSAAETADRVDWVASQAGGRRYRSDVLLQVVALDSDPERYASEWVGDTSYISAQQVLDSPFVLIAPDAVHAAQELRRRHEKYGFDSVTAHQPSMEALGQVIAAYRSS